MNPLPNSGGFCGLYFFRLNVFISSFNAVYLKIEITNGYIMRNLLQGVLCFLSVSMSAQADIDD